MKQIISTTGAKILFNLSRDRKLIIDPVIPIEVTIPEFKILDSRLGAQLREVFIGKQGEATIENQTPPAEIAPEVTLEPMEQGIA